MASPYSAGPSGGGWQNGGQSMHSPAPMPPAEGGMQTRPMGVKVLYSFKDSQENCLARCPGVQHVQTVPLDETTSIGIIDLRFCLQAVAQCSPEIVGHPDLDHNVYAYDYSEPDTPLVGQGMLSSRLEHSAPNGEPQIVTGRVTRNVLAVFGSGARETLEVKLKLTPVSRNVLRPEYQQQPGSTEHFQQQPQPQHVQHQQLQQQHQQQHARQASTPIDTTEWSSFIQSNPALARSASTVSAPPQPYFMPQQPDHAPVPYPGSRPVSRPGSVPLGHPTQRGMPTPPPAPAPTLAQVPVPQAMPAQVNQASTSEFPPLQPAQLRPSTPGGDSVCGPVSKPSRPSSRASKSRATGRPRGRPPKKKAGAADGNTSAVEEPTDVDDGPKKKRAKTTKADSSNVQGLLDGTADSLRITAATSGALRTMRPIGTAGSEGGIAASHLQEGPRAPTPVPKASNMQRALPRKGTVPMISRRESMVSVDDSVNYPGMPMDSSMLAPSPQPQDARSPTESVMNSDAYTPEDSPADLGSSPPVPRSAPFMRTSPMPSSPILPTMPRPQPDSGFMSGGFFEEEECVRPSEAPLAAPPPPAKLEEISAPLPKIAKPVPRKGSRLQQHQGYPFQEVNPGPPELLPVTSIYNPTPMTKKRAEPAPPKLKRANTEPKPPAPLREEIQQHPHIPPPSMSQPPPRTSPPPVEQSEMDIGQLLEAAVAQTPVEEPLDPTVAALQSLDQAVTQEETLVLPEPEPELPTMNPPKTTTVRRPSKGSANSDVVPKMEAPPVPASDPVGPGLHMLLTLPQVPFTEAPCPTSDILAPESTSNKNMVKKQSIKERLEQAIQSGEMPQFCSNCGAIETPTWRKMWTQDHTGMPEFYDYSEKPGHVTAIDITERDADGKPVAYRVVKKTLGPLDPKHKWNELLLCNPCGIWLGKFKTHRPPDRWDRDQSRLNQPRKKRERPTANNSRAKKPRTKSDAAQATSEACYVDMTDPFGPADYQAADTCETLSQPAIGGTEGADEPRRSPNGRGPGSTHSRGSGTANSPIPVDDGLGHTRRLLFPSPRKDGTPKVLGEVAVNVVRTGPAPPLELKEKDKRAENIELTTPTTPGRGAQDRENMVSLFGTPLDRPSTPPPKGSGGPFKTPTRPTPSHRPITRSISKSIRSARSLSGRGINIMGTPSQALAALQRTPSKTPGRQPHAHFADDLHFPMVDSDMLLTNSPFGASLGASITQLLSEAQSFTSGSPSHGLLGVDLNLPVVEGDAHFSTSAAFDFSFFSTDAAGPMPSSPSLGRGGLAGASDDEHGGFGDAASFDQALEMWSQGSETVQMMEEC